MSVRRMDVNDVPACAALFISTFNAPPWSEDWTLEDAERRLADMAGTPGAEGRVCVDHERSLVGFALGHRQRFSASDHFFLEEMCVRTEQQGKGWGSRLLSALHTDLADVTVWSLLTARESDAASFYRRHGYRPATRIEFFVRP